jgi:hypothetical protein
VGPEAAFSDNLLNTGGELIQGGLGALRDYLVEIRLGQQPRVKYYQQLSACRE